MTIFGESAGSTAVMTHMLSPASAGLFHRVIAQSGTPISAYTRSDRKPAFYARLVSLSAAQPTDQGEESILLLLLLLLLLVVVVVVVVGEDHFSVSHVHMYSFLGCEKEKLCLKRGVKRQKLCLKRDEKRQKLCISGCIDLSKILYSTPQISESIPFL